MDTMPAFERLAYFVTGIRCEPTPRGVTIRVVLGVLVTSACVAFTMVFAGAAAGNSNSSASFTSMLWPVATLYAVYLLVTLVSFGKSWQQTAQYLAWSPFLLLAFGLLLGLLFSLARN
jgi:hypothetical protein